MSYYVALYTPEGLRHDGRSKFSASAAAYTGVPGDTRRFLLLAPAEVMAPASAPAAAITGASPASLRIELFPIGEKPSDIPAGNFVPWTPPA